MRVWGVGEDRNHVELNKSGWWDRAKRSIPIDLPPQVAPWPRGSGISEGGAFWLAFLRSVADRGLSGVELVTSDAHRGLREAIATVFAGASWQRCRTHFMTNLLTRVPRRAQPWVATMVRTVYQQPSPEEVHAQVDRDPRKPRTFPSCCFPPVPSILICSPIPGPGFEAQVIDIISYQPAQITERAVTVLENPRGVSMCITSVNSRHYRLRSRRPVAQGAVRPDAVVSLSVPLSQHPDLQERVEDLSVR